MHDYLIRNATIVDGTGAAPFTGDIAIAGGRIVEVGEASGSAKEILDADDFAPVSKRVTQLSKGDGDAKRVDRLATICTRVYLHLAEPAYQPGDQHPDNLVRFLTHKELPNDLRFSLHKDLVNLRKPAVTRMMRNKKLADLVLLGM